MSLMTVADLGHKGLWMVMESVDDRGIHRLLLVARCHRHAILWHNHHSFINGKMTENADSDRKSE